MTETLHAALQQALGDAYLLERELGGGGMARVFVARETALDRTVVVKFIAPELREGLSAERFAREVQLAARLQQANIVPLFTAGDAAGHAYYTMPYVDGQSLRARIERGTLPLGEAVDVLRDVARALAYAHAQGIVHRDIKPENVLLSSGTAVVTDFGIARALSASRTHESTSNTLTQAGTSIGTPAYMAPEQALGDVVDARADLYAWGVVAYELLAGAHPFARHTSAQRLVAAHLGETPAPLGSVRSGIPHDVTTLVSQCLAKDPAQRPVDANELVSRLAAAITPGAGRSESLRAARWRGSATRWLIIGAGFVTAGIATAVVLTRDRQSRAATKTVVVVPFENIGDPANEYFADGVSEEIAGQLARLPGIAVIGRDGVRRFRGSDRSPREIARELGAAFVLSGNVSWDRRNSANGTVDGETRVRIVPAFVDVTTGEQKWREPFEERLTDVFKVQANVAERVASALSVTLGATAREALRRAESSDAEARDAQLLGRYLLRQRGLENLKSAEAAFSRAVSRDSSYARAWAGLAEATALRPAYTDTTESIDAVLARADRAAQRAVALDRMLPEVQIAIARTRAVQFRFQEALTHVDRALALDSNATLTYALKYEMLTALGRREEAGVAVRRAAQLDNLSALALNDVATWFWSGGVMDSAMHYSERAVQIAPAEPVWRRSLGTIYATAGRLADGIATCEAASVAAYICRHTLSSIAGTPFDRDSSLAALGAMAHWPVSVGIPTFAAIAYAKLGVRDSVFARLRAAVDGHDDTFTHLITNKAFEPYQSDPRWDAIVGEVRRR
jgi:serine/threonine-protein kinase